MSSIKRTTGQKEGISITGSTAAARRYAIPGGPTSKSLRSLIHGSSPMSSLRVRSKYELRSISFEGSKVLPWTLR